MLLRYVLWDDWLICMISSSKEQQQKQLEYILLKPDCHSRWISKMQSDTLEERHAIKFCFKLGKNARETYGMLHIAFGASCMNRAWVFEWQKRFKEGRESLSWLAKGLGLLCWGFKGVQEGIPSEEASTLQIGSVAFPPGQYTSRQLHPCHRLFDQDNSSPSQALLPVTSGYSLSSETVVMRQLRRRKRLWRRSLTRSHKGLSRSCWNGTTSALQPE